MLKQVILLSRIQLCNLFRVNEMRYTKDKAKKKQYFGMALAWLLVLMVLEGYVIVLSVGLSELGLAKIIPIYLYAIVSILIMFLSFFKAGSILFSLKDYEMLVPMPVAKSSIIISQFVTMYVMDLLMGLLVLVPGMVIYSIYEQAGILLASVVLIGSLFLPLLPLTISSIIGAFITALSSRMKHKSLGESLLMILVVVVVMGGSMLLGEQAESMDIAALKNLARMVEETIGKIYPPAIWFRDALSGDLLSLGLLLGIPTICFAVFVWLTGIYYQKICAALRTTVAKNNYHMEKLTVSSMVKTLWKKELKCYFSSSVYVTNTIIGYVLAALLCAALFIVGTEHLIAQIGIPEGDKYLLPMLPFGISFVFCITTTTSCAISMEGKYLWLLQTLPVKSKAVIDSKLLLNLTIAAPFYVVAEIFLWLAIKPGLAEGLLLIVVPVCYLCYMAVVGLLINSKFPVFQWENEVQIVKQSMAVLITMLVGMISSVVPIVGILLSEGANWACWIAVVVLFLITILLYGKCSRSNLPGMN